MTVTTAHHETCRMVMGTAWAAKRAEPARTMSACMKSAWRFVKASAKAAARIIGAAARTGGRVRFGDMIARPDMGAAIRAGKATKARMYGSAHVRWR